MNDPTQTLSLKQILNYWYRWHLCLGRGEAEMKDGACAVKYRGPKTIAHNKATAQRTLDTLAHNARDPEYTEASPGPYIRLLASEIERELLLQFDKGLLSLAKHYNCPLMWSHYGDQHQGICLGYSVPLAAQSQVHQVR